MVILTTGTLALILGLGVMIEFFGFYTRGGFISPFIHFIGLAWFFVTGTQTAVWSNVISQLMAFGTGNTLLVQTIPNQPFVLIFPFMLFICLAGMLEAIGALIYGNTTPSTSRGSMITKRDPNRGL